GRPTTRSCSTRKSIPPTECAATRANIRSTTEPLFRFETLLELAALEQLVQERPRVARLALDQADRGVAALRAARTHERLRVGLVGHGHDALHRQAVGRGRPTLDDARAVAAGHRITRAVEPAG